MKKDHAVLNLLVFANEIEKGVLQSDLLIRAKGLGFDKVEIRREYFKELAHEIPVIKKSAEEQGIELFYSVPEEVFVQGKVNPHLKGYLNEAQQMGVKHIKWNIGDFQAESSLKALEELSKQGIEINIENDQTQTSGTIQAINTFMEAVQREKLNIGYVYDLGNWRFVGESEVQAAEALKKYVRYIHVKDVAYENNHPKAVGLDEGVILWRDILASLPQDVPVAIEYPTTDEQQILTAKQLLEEA